MGRVALNWSIRLFSKHIFFCFFDISPCFILIILIFIIQVFLFLIFFLYTVLILIWVWIGSTITTLYDFSRWTYCCYFLDITWICFCLIIILLTVCTLIGIAHIKLKHFLSYIRFFYVFLISKIKFKSCGCSIEFQIINVFKNLLILIIWYIIINIFLIDKVFLVIRI